MASRAGLSYTELRAQLELDWLGPPPSWRWLWPRLDWTFGRWVLGLCMGKGTLPARWVFLRCDTCKKLRTNRRRVKGPCKCGGRKSTNAVPDMTTGKCLWVLATGY